MSLDGIRIVRAGLLIGWLLVAMLAVAGFAAFSADEDTDDVGAAGSNVAAQVGRTAGAVSALAFAGTAETLPPTAAAPLLEFDPTVADAPIRGTAPVEGAPPETADKKGGVYIRSGYLSETEIRHLVSDFFGPADVNRAIRVAWCVSAFNPAAVNPATGASGLFQHLPEDWAERSEAAGQAGASIFSPEANIAVAAWMLYELPGGWSHWDCGP